MSAYCCYASLSLIALSTNVESCLWLKATYSHKYFRILRYCIHFHFHSFWFKTPRGNLLSWARGVLTFTPLVKWEALQNNVNGIKEAAEIYENAFNDILEQVTNNANFEEVGRQVTAIFPPLLSSCVK